MVLHDFFLILLTNHIYVLINGSTLDDDRLATVFPVVYVLSLATTGGCVTLGVNH